ncbi:MAG: hypothetical protein ACR2OZ_14945 [Verrucomicrobiales bacterium]
MGKLTLPDVLHVRRGAFVVVMAPMLTGVLFLLEKLTAEDPEMPSADQTHKVVFEVSIDGVEKWQGVLRNVKNTHKELGGGRRSKSFLMAKASGCCSRRPPPKTPI